MRRDKSAEKWKVQEALHIAAAAVGMLLSLLPDLATAVKAGRSWREDLPYVLVITFGLVLALTLFTYFLRVKDSSKVSKLKREITSAYSAALRSSRINPEPPTRELHA